MMHNIFPTRPNPRTNNLPAGKCATTWLPRQRGIAVVTALLLTTLAVTIVTGLFWQQQVQVRAMENQRLNTQTQWILLGALDSARLILRDAGAGLTTLDDVWAAPLADTRLDQYIEREKIPGETFNATLSQQIVDAQSRYNLTNLTKAGRINPEQVMAFERLLTNLHLDPALAQFTAQAMAPEQPAAAVNPEEPQPQLAQPISTSVGITQLDDLLSVSEFTPAILAKLHDFIVVLPEATAINVNTASAEVLTTLVNLSLPEAQALVAARRQAYFKDQSDFVFRLNNKETFEGVSFDVTSRYFLVQSKIRLDRAKLDAQALIQRPKNDNRIASPSLIWVRES